MLTVHLLGHAHVTYNNRPVPLSAKAVALITYLTIEKLPQHRERLADLLWNTPEARKNLRVELARIRSAGLNLFPLSRQLLYLENVETDLDGWLSQLGTELDQAGLAQWLSTLRGVPLSGLEDLGSPAFQEWIDHQRWVLTEQVEDVLGRAYRQFQRGGKGWATRAVAARAEALGFVHPGEFLADEGEPDADFPPVAGAHGANDHGAAGQDARPELQSAGPARESALDQSAPDQLEPGADLAAAGAGADGPLHFSVPGREQGLRRSLHRAAQAPQVVVLHGPTGSGKSYEADRALADEGWLALRVSNSRAGRLVVATLAQSLLAHPFLAPPAGGDQAGVPGDAAQRGVQGDAARTLQDVLLRPGSLEEDLVKVATVLAPLPQPLAIVLDHAHNAPVELASLLEFLLNVPAACPRALVMLSRTPPAQAPLCRALLRRFGESQSLVLEVTPLSLSSVVQALGARGGLGGGLAAPGIDLSGADLYAQAAALLQRSGGNPLHLLALLAAGGLPRPGAGPIPLVGPGAGGPPSPGRLPSCMRDTYLGEIDGWPAPLREALSHLSVIQGDFSFTLTESLPASARSGLSAAALLRAALDCRALVEAEAPSALAWPAFGPLGDVTRSEPWYRFRSEGLRIALAGLLPQAERQALRRHLAAELEASQPGLALYYAERAGADQDAERLRGVYRARLGAGSPLLRSPAPASPVPVKPVPVKPAPASGAPGAPQAAQPLHAHGVAERSVPEPRRTRAAASAAVTWQGYRLAWEPGGWLSVLSQGRYGHPHTLRVHVPVPAGLRDAPVLTLRVVWRLDVFHGGHELGPSQVAFPLRFAVPGADGARVLTPDATPDYAEEGQRQEVHSDVTLGTWLRHDLVFNLAGQPAERLELHVRALDLALTIGELSLNGQPLLPLAAAPERLGVAGVREDRPAAAPPLTVQR